MSRGRASLDENRKPRRGPEGGKRILSAPLKKRFDVFRRTRRVPLVNDRIKPASSTGHRHPPTDMDEDLGNRQRKGDEYHESWIKVLERQERHQSARDNAEDEIEPRHMPLQIHCPRDPAKCAIASLGDLCHTPSVCPRNARKRKASFFKSVVFPARPLLK